MIHKTVLLKEAIDGLDIHPGETFIDGTLGGGGHIEEVCKRFGNAITMIGIDQDAEALERSRERLSGYNCDIKLVQDNFRNIDEILWTLGVNRVDKILLDIGLSSNQFEESGRGFSFQKDEPLVMTFKKNPEEDDLTAAKILNNWDEENIRTILESYGEEKFAYQIAKAIVQSRQEKPIETTSELVEIIKSATPPFYHHRKINPATKTFQALRITVNDEIGSLKDALRKGFEKLSSGGRMAIISFHSLEDREVKNYFKERAANKEAVLITKKPIVPTEKEIEENPRSRSAKLRIIQKL